MTRTKWILTLAAGIAALVVLSQTALAATVDGRRAVAAKPQAAKVMRNQAQASRFRVGAARPMAHARAARYRGGSLTPNPRISWAKPMRHSARAVSPARMRVQVSALGRLRPAGFRLP